MDESATEQCYECGLTDIYLKVEQFFDPDTIVDVNGRRRNLATEYIEKRNYCEQHKAIGEQWLRKLR